MRSLLFFLVIIVVFLLIRQLFKPKQTVPSKSPPETKQMVSCHYCGIHLPKEEAIKDRHNPEQYFCSEAHAVKAHD